MTFTDVTKQWRSKDHYILRFVVQYSNMLIAYDERGYLTKHHLNGVLLTTGYGGCDLVQVKSTTELIKERLKWWWLTGDSGDKMLITGLRDGYYYMDGWMPEADVAKMLCSPTDNGPWRKITD